MIVAGIMSLGLAILKRNTMVTFILTFIAVNIVAVCAGMKLNELEEVTLTGFKKTAQVCMIFIAVGMVVGSWIISGIFPSIIYYGLKIFTPSSFLALGFIVCCVVSFFTGSSSVPRPGPTGPAGPPARRTYRRYRPRSARPVFRWHECPPRRPPHRPQRRCCPAWDG